MSVSSSALTLSEKILSVESKYSLFEHKINNIQIYPLIRMGLYYEISRKLKYYSNQPISKYKFNIQNILKTVIHMVRFNDFTNFKTESIVVIEHPRRSGKNNFDIYTDFLNKFLNVSIIKNPLYGNHFLDDQSKKNFIHYDYFLVKKKIINIFFHNSEIDNYVNYLANIIADEIDNENDYKKYLEQIIKDKIISCNIALKFFSRLKIKKLIIVNSYGFNHMVWAAKKYNIETIELQHGIISQHHLGYHFPNIKQGDIEYFPDYLVTFGKFWNTQAHFPISSQNVLPFGYNYFSEQKNKFFNKSKQRNNNILVLSQSTIGSFLSIKIEALAKRFCNYNFFYKPHPKEIITSEKYLKQLSKIQNVSVVKDSEAELYELFTKCEWQIGVFSTALFEGLGFGLKTLIFKLPGWQNMKSLEGMKGIFFSNDVKDAIEIIKKECEIPDLDIFFDKNATKNNINFFRE